MTIVTPLVVDQAQLIGLIQGYKSSGSSWVQGEPARPEETDSGQR
jgi:hypothetical protein